MNRNTVFRTERQRYQVVGERGRFFARTMSCGFVSLYYRGRESVVGTLMSAKARDTVNVPKVKVEYANLKLFDWLIYMEIWQPQSSGCTKKKKNSEKVVSIPRQRYLVL